MNLDTVLKDLGLQERAGLLRSKKVTLNTFRDMDGSAKQIILFSQKLGLSAEDVVNIKAHIEDKVVPAEANAYGDNYRQNQMMRSQGPGKHYQTQFTSRQMPNSKSIEFRNASRPNGQMIFGQKGALMKQDKVILDYGRKNRIQKIVQGGQSMASSSNNLARKGTHQLSLNMDQYLASNLANKNGKHSLLNQYPSSYPRQQSNEPQQEKIDQAGFSKSPNTFAQKQLQNQRRSPGHYNQNGMRNGSFDKMKNDNLNQSSVSSSMMVAAQRNQLNQIRESSANSESRQPNGKNSTSQDASQKVTATFGPSNGIQTSSGPASSSIQNNPFNRSSNGLNQLKNESDYDLHKNKNPNEIQPSEQNPSKLLNNDGFKVPFSHSEQNQQKIKPSNNVQTNQYASNQYISHDNTLRDTTQRDQQFQQIVNNGKSDLQMEKLQYLGNKQSQDYLSQKLGKLCNQLADQSKKQQIILSGNQVKDLVEQRNQQMNNYDVDPQFDQNEQKQILQNGNEMQLTDPLNSQKISQTVSQIEQYDEKENEGQQHSESDLDDPEQPYDDEIDEHNQEMHYEKAEDKQMQEQSDEEEQVDDQTDEQDQNLDDDSNSKLSEHQAQMNTDNINHLTNQQTQAQHHSRPTIGMKQPAQHYLKKIDEPMDKDDVRSIQSESSSMHDDPHNSNQYQQPGQNQNFVNDNVGLNRGNTNSDRSDDDQDEEESEFFQNKPAQLLSESYNKNIDVVHETKQHQDHRIEQDESLEDNEASEDKSDDDNYDDEEMPDDTDYQKKVQMLHENRQRSAQHLWGASRHPQNNASQDAQPLSHTKANESVNTHNDANPIDQNDVDEEEESSDYSDDDDEDKNELESLADQRQIIASENQKNEVDLQNQSQPSQLKQLAMQSQQDQSQMQRSQQQSNKQLSQNIVTGSQNANIAVYTHDQSKLNFVRQLSQDQLKNSVVSNNQGVMSSQNTFLEMAGAHETVQQSKHSSIAHSFHRQQLQNSQQQLAVKATHAPSPQHAQMSQNTILNKEQKMKATYQQSGVMGNSQQNSFHSNIREPHHLLIENDDKSNGQSNLTKQNQSNSYQPLNTAQYNQTAAQAQPNNQEMFEQLHNQMKVQSQGSNFNLSLQQMNAKNNAPSNSQNDGVFRRQDNLASQLQQQLMKPMQSNGLSPTSRFSQAQEQNQDKSNQNKVVQQQSNLNLASQTSQVVSPIPGNKSVARQLNSPSGSRLIVGSNRSKPYSPTPLQVQNQVVQYITNPMSQSQRILSCNKEIGAQEDLTQLLIDKQVQAAKVQTAKEVKEQVTKDVTQQVTQDVRQETTLKVSQQVRYQVEQELKRTHQSELQGLKDQYELSAQQQNRQEEKLHHQIGQLETAVADANKHLDEKQSELRRMFDLRNQLESQIQNLENQVSQKNSELQNINRENQQQLKDNQATVQQLLGEKQVDRSNIVLLNQQIEKQSADIQASKKHVQNLQEDLQNMKNELLQEQEKYENLENRFMIIQANISNKESQISNMNQQINVLKNQKMEIYEQRLENEKKLKEEADLTAAQLKKTIEDLQKEKNKDQDEKDDLMKKLDEAKRQTQRAIEREQALIKQQRARSQTPKQEFVNSPKQNQIHVSDKRSLTPQVQMNFKQSPQISKNIQSAKTDLMSRNTTTNAQSPQRPLVNQNQQDLQLKQERLQQLLQLQMKQDELIKLEMQLKTTKQKVSQGQLQQSSNELASQTQQSKSNSSPNCTDFEIKKNETDTKYLQVMSQQIETVGKFNESKQVTNNGQKKGLTNIIDLMGNGHDEQDEQDQDDDNLICNSGSKHKMHHIKEESSYLPDCVETEKNIKKKIVKKVRFHDDEQEIEQPFKNERSLDNNQIMTNDYVNSQSNERFQNMQSSNKLIGKKRNKLDFNNEDEYVGNGFAVHHLNSNEQLSGSIGQDHSLQQVEKLDIESHDEDLQFIEASNSNINRKTNVYDAFKPNEYDQLRPDNQADKFANQIEDDVRQARQKQNDKLRNDEELIGGYKCQKVFDQQHAQRKGVSSTNLSLTESTHEADMQLRQVGSRLRKKAFQEDQFNLQESSDEFVDKQMKRKRKLQGGANQFAGKSGQANASNGNSAQKQVAKGATGRQNQQSGTGTQSESLQQKMKQIVGSNDQYLKSNPKLLSMIMAMSKK